MFPVRTTARFDVNIRRITQNLYFSGIEDPDQGLKTSLVAALVNVRTFPEAYPRTGKARRRFVFEFRSIPHVVLYAFDGELVVLHDIHFARSAQTAHWLSEGSDAVFLHGSARGGTLRDFNRRSLRRT